MDYTQLKSNFIAAMKAGIPGAQREWMGTVIDYDQCKRLGLPYDDKAPRKLLDLERVFMDSLDYNDGPTHADLILVLAGAMQSTDPHVKQAATDLVNRCAHMWASMNEDIIED